jgi:hypothetical protein
MYLKAKEELWNSNIPPCKNIIVDSYAMPWKGMCHQDLEAVGQQISSKNHQKETKILQNIITL